MGGGEGVFCWRGGEGRGVDSVGGVRGSSVGGGILLERGEGVFCWRGGGGLLLEGRSSVGRGRGSSVGEGHGTHL